MQQPIHTIIFDLGRVLIGYAEDRGMRRLAGLVKNADGVVLHEPAAISAYLNSPTPDGVKPWQGYRTAMMLDLIPPLVQERAGPAVSPELLRDAYCDVFYPLPDRVRLLRHLAARDQAGTGPRLALLSDTVQLHTDHIENNADGLLQILPPERLFYSYRDTHCLKADGPNSYRIVLDAMGADPATTLMIDDTLANRQGALDAGMQFLHIQPEENLEARLFNEYGIVARPPAPMRRLIQPGF